MHYFLRHSYADLRAWRSWYRGPIGSRWPDLAENNRSQLREEVQRRWSARRAARAASQASWAPGELTQVYGS